MVDALYQPFPMAGRARAQIWRYSPEYRRPRHFHSELELNLVVAGSGAFGVGDSMLRVTAGDLLSWLPGQDHVLLEASLDFDLFVVGLTPSLSDRVLGASHAWVHGGPAQVNVSPSILARFRELCAAPLAHEPSAVERHVGDLWRDAHALRAASSNRHVLAKRALALVLARPDVTRDDVARIARGNPAEVSKHFRRDVGLTFVDYRTRLRLLRFIEAADERADNLLSAAGAAGFGSYSQCHRAFTKTFGCTPRAFFQNGARDEMRDAFDGWKSRPSQRSTAHGLVNG